MDKRVMRERMRRKQRQLRRRRRIKLFTYVAGVILAIVFVVRGVIFPIMNRVGKKSTGESVEVQAQTEQTDPNAAIRQPLKGAGDTEKTVYLTQGWHDTENGRFYQNADGTYYAGGFQTINGVQYSFDDNGYVQTGWVAKGAVDYYFNDDGSYNPEKKRPMVALTFDDGPGEYTETLLNCLEENNAHATFFMLGQNVTLYPDAVKHMAEIGCEIGNHSYDHQNMYELDLDSVAKQFSNTDEALRTVIGQTATVARAPYGNWSEDIIAAVGKPFFMWSLDSMDWSYKDVEKDYDAVMNSDSLGDGTIILMHDIHEPSVQAALRIIPDLIAKGYKLVTVSELAAAKNVVLQNASYSEFWQSSLDQGLVAGYQGNGTSSDTSSDTSADSENSESTDGDSGSGEEGSEDYSGEDTDGSGGSEEDYESE